MVNLSSAVFESLEKNSNSIMERKTVIQLLKNRILSHCFICCVLIFCATSANFGLSASSDEYDYCNGRISYHNGMKYCCKCFIHCDCFGQCVGKYDVCFPSGNDRHPLQSIDKAWHEFMNGILTAKKVGPFVSLDEMQVSNLVGFHPRKKNKPIHSISDYLVIIEKFRSVIDRAKFNSIAVWENYYSSPREKSKLEEKLKLINQQYYDAHQILDELPSRIIPLYEQAIRDCKHFSSFSIYNKGLIHSLKGDWDEAIIEIQNLMGAGENNQLMHLNSEVLQTCGEACLEANLFNEAIDALTTAINKNPQNKQAYFFRASAFFEKGDFDQALKDYLESDRGSEFFTSQLAPKGFKDAFFNSMNQGISEAAVEFFPSLCNTIHGLGTTLWAMHPLNPHVLENAEKLANTCYEMGQIVVETCKNSDWSQVDWYAVDDSVDQIKILYERFDQLSDSEKGELLGHTIGKYGTDILAGCFIGGAVVKGGERVLKSAKAFRNLKNINRTCNLEAMAVSNANKEALVSSALKHAAEREAYLKNVKIEWDKQSKHIVGKHNFLPNKSVLEHSDPESLLKKYAGLGTPVRESFGKPGYQEIVNFEEIIGYYMCETTQTGLPTTWGKIHYSKNGAHIVPTRPRK